MASTALLPQSRPTSRPPISARNALACAPDSTAEVGAKHSACNVLRHARRMTWLLHVTACATNSESSGWPLHIRTTK
eukprot:13515145-Alexandrium_andersonii.AAC.1